MQMEPNIIVRRNLKSLIPEHQSDQTQDLESQLPDRTDSLLSQSSLLSVESSNKSLSESLTSVLKKLNASTELTQNNLLTKKDMLIVVLKRVVRHAAAGNSCR